MAVNPDACGESLVSAAARREGGRRLRREQVRRGLVGAGTCVVLAGLLSMPIYLMASLVHANAAIDWGRLGVLALGTARAALVAMTLALPAGLACALFSAHFAAPKVRALLKPGLEILEGVPTVILGLVAVATAVPWLERHLGALLVTIAAFPFLLLAAGFLVGARPGRSQPHLRMLVLAGVVVIAVGALFAAASKAPGLWHAASPWNAVAVGLALGVATIPTIFSVAEDALFLVPRAHTQAAFALGATRWQAVTTVVLPAAGSGLLAAALVGLGRCLGETMIVIMASGNTALATLDPLAGLRSLSAEVALGMPEASPADGPWRHLILATLLLLASSALFSVVAERIRSRLRGRLARGVRA